MKQYYLPIAIILLIVLGIFAFFNHTHANTEIQVLKQQVQQLQSEVESKQQDLTELQNDNLAQSDEKLADANEELTDVKSFIRWERELQYDITAALDNMLEEQKNLLSETLNSRSQVESKMIRYEIALEDLMEAVSEREELLFSNNETFTDLGFDMEEEAEHQEEYDESIESFNNTLRDYKILLKTLD